MMRHKIDVLFPVGSRAQSLTVLASFSPPLPGTNLS